MFFLRVFSWRRNSETQSSWYHSTSAKESFYVTVDFHCGIQTASFLEGKCLVWFFRLCLCCFISIVWNTTSHLLKKTVSLLVIENSFFFWRFLYFYCKIISKLISISRPYFLRVYIAWSKHDGGSRQLCELSWILPASLVFSSLFQDFS